MIEPVSRCDISPSAEGGLRFAPHDRAHFCALPGWKAESEAELRDLNDAAGLDISGRCECVRLGVASRGAGSGSRSVRPSAR